MSDLCVGVAVTCTVCGNRKAPIGRSVPMEMYLCNYDCPGYRLDPDPGSLWPGETCIEFGYLNCGHKASEGGDRE